MWIIPVHSAHRHQHRRAATSARESHFPLFWCFSFPFLVDSALYDALALILCPSNYPFVVYQCTCSTQEIYAGLIRDTDNPTTIYGDLGKLRHIVFVTLTTQRPYMANQENFVTFLLVTLTIQRPYMAIQENFVALFSVTLTIQRPYMADLGYYRELSCHSRNLYGMIFVFYRLYS